jgi:endonuclease/exonuclease/phosphatase family metal-dependent hydrolase
MYKKAIVFLAFSMIAGYKSYSQKKNYKVVAVSFYNLENYFDPENDPNRDDEDFTPNGANRYTKEIYAQKAHNMAYAISKLAVDVTPDGPAIIGLAEIENDIALNYLVSQPEINDRNYKFVWHYRSDRRGISNALLYNPKYFTVLSSESLFVDIEGKNDYEHPTTRDVLHVTGVLAGDTVHVLVNHWPSRRGGESATAPLRAVAAGVGKKKIDSLMKVNPNTKVILMGDLNDDPIDPSITKVLKASSEKERTKKDQLFNPFTAYYKKGIGTGSFNNAWNLFDQIMITGTFLEENAKGWQYYKSEVFNKEFLTQKFGNEKGTPHRSYLGSNWNNGYSDHFPTIIYFIQ